MLLAWEEGWQGGDVLTPICRKGFPKTMELQFEFPSLSLPSPFMSPGSSTQMRSCMWKHFINYFYDPFSLRRRALHRHLQSPSVPEVRELSWDRRNSFSVPPKKESSFRHSREVVKKKGLWCHGDLVWALVLSFINCMTFAEWTTLILVVKI